MNTTQPVARPELEAELQRRVGAYEHIWGRAGVELLDDIIWEEVAAIGSAPANALAMSRKVMERFEAEWLFGVHNEQ
jgi:hypothetical protein